MFDAEQARHCYDDFMRFTKDLEILRFADNEYTCLLKNHPHAAGYFYGQSHGSLTMYYCQSMHCVALHIHSTDDGSITFLGPDESEEDAEDRIHRLINEIHSWDGWIPNAKQCLDVEKQCGVYWNR